MKRKKYIVFSQSEALVLRRLIRMLETDLNTAIECRSLPGDNLAILRVDLADARVMIAKLSSRENYYYLEADQT